jgi:hypothetical protein
MKKKQSLPKKNPTKKFHLAFTMYKSLIIQWLESTKWFKKITWFVYTKKNISFIIAILFFQGDLMYLQVITCEEKSFHITACTKGFYVSQ